MSEHECQLENCAGSPVNHGETEPAGNGKGISRRRFIQLAGLSAAGLGLTGTYLGQIREILTAAAAGRPPVIWIQGASCTGCSISLLNTVHPDVRELLFEIISLEYHSTVMAAAGTQATEAMFSVAEETEGEFVLVVEGSIPTANDGVHCTLGLDRDGNHLTALEVARDLGARAGAVVGLGTCGAFGGIPAGRPDPTRARGIGDVVDGTPVVNIPGCPPHPDWIVGTLAHVLKFGLPELDHHGRPTMFFGGLIHENCPRHSDYDRLKFAERLGDPGCLIKLGCRGPVSRSDCFDRQWNGGVNWCIRSRGPCIGCVNVGFPDEVSPLYVELPEGEVPDTPLALAGGTESESSPVSG